MKVVSIPRSEESRVRRVDGIDEVGSMDCRGYLAGSLSSEIRFAASSFVARSGDASRGARRDCLWRPDVAAAAHA